MKTYRIMRCGLSQPELGYFAAIEVFVIDDGPLRRLRHVVYHSPDGFETGCDGSGPADLALSILSDYFGSGQLAPRAMGLHQLFKQEVIAKNKLAPSEHYDIDTEFIGQWLASIGEESLCRW